GPADSPPVLGSRFALDTENRTCSDQHPDDSAEAKPGGRGDRKVSRGSPQGFPARGRAPGGEAEGASASPSRWSGPVFRSREGRPARSARERPGRWGAGELRIPPDAPAPVRAPGGSVRSLPERIAASS